MADKKISALTSATTPLAGTEVLPIVQSGATVKVAISDVTAGRNVSMAKLGVGTTPSGTRFFDILSSNAASQEIGSILASSLNDSAYVDVLLGKTTANDRCAFTRFTNGTGVGDSKYQIGIYGQPTPAFDVRYNNDVAVNTGNLVIGTSGKGIDFSATSGSGTSELLADYEEGTWTPVDGSGAGLVYAAATGYYTKIGRIVTVVFNVTYPATADASAARVGGLPFTAANTGSGLSNGCFNTNNSGQAVEPSIVLNDTKFAALIVAAGVSATNVQLTGATLRGGLTYFV